MNQVTVYMVLATWESEGYIVRHGLNQEDAENLLRSLRRNNPTALVQIHELTQDAGKKEEK